MELPDELKVTIARQLDSASIANLRLTCTNLKLAASKVFNVSVKKRENFLAAIEFCKKDGITALTVTDTELTDDDLLLIKEKLPELERLNLAGCGQLTDAGLAHLQSLTKLKQLNLSKCFELTDDGLVLLKSLKALQQLDLGWCEQLTDAGVNLLRSQLRNCVVTTSHIGEERSW